MRRALPIVVAALAVAVVLGACSRPRATVQELPAGPLTKQRYIEAFERSAEGLADRYGAASDAQGDSAAERERHVAALQRVLRAWADRLEGLQPPAAAQRAQVRYVAGVRHFAFDLDRARAALRAGDVAGAQRLLDSGAIVSAATRADLIAARDAFHRLGYDINNLDESPVRTDR